MDVIWTLVQRRRHNRQLHLELHAQRQTALAVKSGPYAQAVERVQLLQEQVRRLRKELEATRQPYSGHVLQSSKEEADDTEAQWTAELASRQQLQVELSDLGKHREDLQRQLAALQGQYADLQGAIAHWLQQGRHLASPTMIK
jgi:chromosome segregation ATPase